jgi:hypothetical protein
VLHTTVALAMDPASTARRGVGTRAVVTGGTFTLIQNSRCCKTPTSASTYTSPGLRAMNLCPAMCFIACIVAVITCGLTVAVTFATAVTTAVTGTTTVTAACAPTVFTITITLACYVVASAAPALATATTGLTPSGTTTAMLPAPALSLVQPPAVTTGDGLEGQRLERGRHL